MKFQPKPKSNSKPSSRGRRDDIQKPAKGSSIKPSRTKSIPDDKKLKVIGHQLKPCIIISESSLNLPEDELSDEDFVEENELLDETADALEDIQSDDEPLLTASVMQELLNRLQDHELIKVKIRLADREDRQTVLAEIIDITGARLIQSIGKVALIFKPTDKFSPKKSNIEQYSHFIS